MKAKIKNGLIVYQRPRLQDSQQIRDRLSQVGDFVGSHNDGKSQCIWKIKFNGCTVSVYDWKRYDGDDTLHINCAPGIEQEFIDFIFSTKQQNG